MIRLCTVCFERKGKRVTATYIEHGYKLCDDCLSDEGERQHEARIAAYWGGSGPQTIDEQYQAAVKERRELRRLD